MNVLVYNGPGTSKRSVTGCITSLTALLSPYYSVRVISPASLLNEPWPSTTALLVIPGGRDLPYCTELNGAGTKKIDEYVRRGGRYLGLCAGAYWASKTVEFELGTPTAVQGSRELSFFQGICRGCAFPGFVYDSEQGAIPARLRVVPRAYSKGLVPCRSGSEIYWNGGGVFVNAAGDTNVDVLAEYEDAIKVDGGDAAVIHLAHGNGSVVLSAVHPEISMAKPKTTQAEPAPASLGKTLDPTADVFVPLQEATEIRERQRNARFDLLRIITQTLGLKSNAELATIPQLSTLHLLCYSDKIRGVVGEIIRKAVGHADAKKLDSEQDKFIVTNEASQRPEPNDDIEDDNMTLDEQVKYICVHRHPPAFSLFDWNKYFALLHKLHYSSQTPSKSYNDPTFGTSLLYAEIVTSTQSLLDKNFRLQRRLPHGFTILGSHQVAGRGRGQNSWISPAGVLSFSTLLHHEQGPDEKPNAIVFLQYLVSLAVVESILKLRPQLDLKIKWPNDIYLALPPSSEASLVTFVSGGTKYAKVSGSLITTNYHQGKYILTIGIGINVSNLHPTISLNSVLPEAEAISLEELLATFMVTFAHCDQDFISSGASFRDFEQRYYRYWLHTNQSVTVEASGERGTIQGLDLADGTLKVKTDKGIIGLQADGNSFDMLKGLLKTKQ